MYSIFWELRSEGVNYQHPTPLTKLELITVSTKKPQATKRQLADLKLVIP